MVLLSNAALALGAVAVLAACAAPHPKVGPPVPGMTPQAVRSVVYTCGGEPVVARFESEALELLLPERTLRLPQVPTDSGGRYGAGPATFWTKENSALLIRPNRPDTTCRVGPPEGPWQDAARRGADFRAVGQEPGWLLDIEDGERISLLADYGETRITASAPPPVREDGRTVYRTETAARTMMVAIADDPCRDAMSGHPYPATVVVSVNGRTYRGCGMTLSADAAPTR